MRIPGVDTLSRVPVPRIVPAAVAPVVQQSTTYAMAAGRHARPPRRRRSSPRSYGASTIEPRRWLDNLDLTEIVLTRVDLDAVVRQVLVAVDEDEIATVVAKVDVDTIVRSLDIDVVLDQMDLTRIVLERVDLVKVVDAVLDRMDLTTIVLNRVDLVKVVDAVLDQMDLIALANEIIDGVDLPEIIRDSTGSMASETVKGVRMQGIGADQAVDRAIDRLLLRRSRGTGSAGS